MNYLTEIKLFYDWLETHELSPTSIALWHGLMHIANRSGWKTPLRISASLIEFRTGIPRSTLKRERKKLVEAGLLSVEFGKGRSRTSYRLCSLAVHFTAQYGLQSEPQNDERVQVVAQNEPQVVPSILYKLNYIDSLKENIKEKSEVGADAPPSLFPSPERKEKSCGKKEKKTPSPQIDNPRFGMYRKWVEENTPTVAKMREPFTEEQFEQLMTKYSHQEVTKILRAMENHIPLLKKNKSAYLTALNWLGRQSATQSRARGQPAQGQRIGQIKQPDSEDDKNRILEKFGKPKK